MSGRFALLIGNSTFEDPALARLSAPENDVIALKEVLERAEIAGFETRLLLNAGMDDARGAVFDLFRDRTPDDLVLLYYTGHGLRDEHGDLYLALPQTTARAPGKIALEADFVRRQMEKSYSRRQVLILDCCHSGAFVKGSKRADGAPALTREDFLPVGGHGRYILAAAAANQSAFEAEGRSIFTRHLVDALRNGEAAPEREAVTISDLHAYVCRRVASDLAPMQPRIWVDEETAPLVIARNPNPRRPLPQELVDMLWAEDVHRAHSAAIRLVGIARGGDAQLAADAGRVLRQRLEKPEDLALLVAAPILEALGLQRSPALEAEVRELTAALAAERAARGALEERLAAREGELAAQLSARVAELAGRRERIAELEAEIEALRDAGAPEAGAAPATVDVVAPTLGESVEEAEVATWLKQLGDAVALDEALCELETDKVTFEVSAPAAGVLAAIDAPAGARVRPGARLGVVAPGQPPAAEAAGVRIGRATIGRVYDVPGVGKVAGCRVTEGRARLGAPVRLLRPPEKQRAAAGQLKGKVSLEGLEAMADAIAVRKGWIRSLQRSRRDVREAGAGEDCGMTFGGIADFQEGDVVEIFGG